MRGSVFSEGQRAPKSVFQLIEELSNPQTPLAGGNRLVEFNGFPGAVRVVVPQFR